MDNVKLLESAILVIRDRVGKENAIIRDFRILIDLEKNGDKSDDPNLQDPEHVVKVVCKQLSIDYDDVLYQMNGGSYDWESLLKEEEDNG